MKNKGLILEIDGSQGEGGGQILRTSLALSAVKGIPFRLRDIRGKRKKPGLLRQHLTCVRAAKEICEAEVEGDTLNSRELLFIPGKTKPGEYHWNVGSAGSAGLVLQTILYPLLFADGKSTVCIEGGTHNDMAPPFDFLDQSFRPIINDLGFDFGIFINRYGFYPAGGGVIRAEIDGSGSRNPVDTKRVSWEKEKISVMEVHAYSSGINERINLAELELTGSALGIPEEKWFSRMVDSPGPGNALSVKAGYPSGKNFWFTSFGKTGLPLEKVSEHCIGQVRRWMNSGACIEEHLQDQILVPLALGNGGGFTTVEPSVHTKTNMEIISMFLKTEFETRRLGEKCWEIGVFNK